MFFMSAGFVAQNALTGTTHSTITAAAIGYTVSAVAYLVFLRPSVTMFDEGLTIRNPIDEVTVGWHCVELMEADYDFKVRYNGGKKIKAWAAVAPGAWSNRRAIRLDSIDGRAMSVADANLRRTTSETGAALQTAERIRDRFDPTRMERIATVERKKPAVALSAVLSATAAVLLIAL